MVEQDYLTVPALFGLRQQVKHLAIFGGETILIEGEHGSGKTSLMHALIGDMQSLNDDSLQVQISELSLSQSSSSPPSILAKVHASLGLAFSGQPDSAQQLQTYIRRLLDEQKLSLLFIDDAHGLTVSQ